jgi:hypothetical protein
METKVCNKCGACFYDGVLYWGYNGKRGNPLDLASLVCRPYGDNQCINPCRNLTGGDTFQARIAFIQNNPFGGSQ